MSMIIVSEPNWKPLEQLFSREECAAFMYIGHLGTIELYKHRDTRRYLNIDTRTGEFYLHRGNNDYMKVAKPRLWPMYLANPSLSDRCRLQWANEPEHGKKAMNTNRKEGRNV